eukprot:SAG31_NODE_10709_length_1107_cov_6.703373_1_plen_21_part_10
MVSMLQTSNSSNEMVEGCALL